MKLSLLWISLLGFWTITALAWTKEDHEIFDLVSAIEASEGKGTTFYSWLEVSPSASSAEISRAYRKKSIQLHPDKNQGRRDADERFARLGVVAQILRNREGRERYDFFFKNGVPRWRGTGYYYSRYRPGLGSVAVFLVIVTSIVHYVVQQLNYSSDIARIDRFMREARLAAWGPKMVPLEGRRKVKIAVGGRARMDEDGNIIPGKQLDMVVEGSNVYIVEPDGDLLQLDAGAASLPSLQRTWFLALLLTISSRLRGSKQGAEDGETEANGRHGGADDSDEDGAASTSETSGNSRGVTPSTETVKSRTTAAKKAGGRRRKAPARTKGAKKDS